MRKPSKKALAVTLATAALLSGAGAAFAYWTNSGRAPAPQRPAPTWLVTVNQTSVVSGLYPGMSAPNTLAGNFDNPNAGPAYVTAVTATGYTIDAPHVTAGCVLTGGQLHAGRHRHGWRRRSRRPQQGRLDRLDDPHEQPGDQPGRLQGRHGHHHLRQQLTEQSDGGWGSRRQPLPPSAASRPLPEGIDACKRMTR